MRVSLFWCGAYIHVAVCLWTLVQSKRLDAAEATRQYSAFLDAEDVSQWDIEVKISKEGLLTISTTRDGVPVSGTASPVPVLFDKNPAGLWGCYVYLQDCKLESDGAGGIIMHFDPDNAKYPEFKDLFALVKANKREALRGRVEVKISNKGLVTIEGDGVTVSGTAGYLRVRFSDPNRESFDVPLVDYESESDAAGGIIMHFESARFAELFNKQHK